MGLRFRKSVRLIPGVRLNLGLKSASVSIGGPGATYNVGPKGSRVTVGLPGSGLSYSSMISSPNPAAPTSQIISALRWIGYAAVIVVILIVSLFAFPRSKDNPKIAAQTSPKSDKLQISVVTTPAVTTPVVTSFDVDRPRGDSERVPLPRPRPTILTGTPSGVTR